MNVVFYGASVTAQKFQSGYFQILKDKLAEKSLPVKVDRVAYGASHFDWAGFAMISKVLAMKPDICFLDWVTPSSVRFSSEKIHFISKLLIDRGCLPVWVLLPRIDDYAGERSCCKQIREYASIHKLPCHEVVKECGISRADLAELLRDVVHTSESGAEVYSNFFLGLIEHYSEVSVSDLCQASLLTYGPQHDVGAPAEIYPLDGEVSNTRGLQLTLNIDEGARSDGKVELFLNAKIGPKIPLLVLKVYSDAHEMLYEQRLNFADPWCYYERDMLLNFPVIQLKDHTVCTLSLEIKDGNPLDEINLRQPIKDPSSGIEQRVLPFFEVIVHGAKVENAMLQGQPLVKSKGSVPN